MKPSVRKGFNVKVGEKLKSLRKSRGMTQQQLADVLDTNAKYISQLEGGNAGIGPDVVNRYCDYFNITPEDLYNSENKKGGKYPPIMQMIIDELSTMPLH